MDNHTTVASFLAAAGFSPDQAEVEALQELYPLINGMVSMLYGVEEARYESPAMHFDPNPTFADWF